MGFEYQIKHREGAVIVDFFDRILDVSEADQLVHQIERQILGGNRKFIINFQQVDYINSSGLNVLITLLTKIRDNYGELYICAVSDKIEKLIHTTKLDKIFKIEDNVEQAIEKLK